MTRPTRQRERARESEGEDVDQDEAAACPECSSEDILKDADRGELVCNDCGLVVEEDHIDD